MRGLCLYLLAVLAFTCVGALASIEREPVKVDRSNAGPKYDIDELERTRVLADNSNSNNNNQDSNQVPTGPNPFATIGAPSRPDDKDDNSHQDTPMISIRRIFLVPISSSSQSNGNGNGNDEPNGERQMSDPMRAIFGMPTSMFSPFGSPHNHNHNHNHEHHGHGRVHLFGGDEASRPRPSLFSSDESQERPVSMSGPQPEQEAPTQERPRPMSAMFDPVEMLMEAMRQALNPANMMPQPPAPEADLNKEASGSPDEKKSPTETGAAEQKPQSFNSTKEDIVEIDGKKYLRKTVIQRHVGEGIMFMTRRLIFSPLNETETTTTTTTTEPTVISKEATTVAAEPSTEQPSRVEKIDEPVPAPVAPEKEPVASEQPKPPQQDPSTTTTVAPSDKEETTTTEKSLGDKIGETVARVERLMEKALERKEEVESTSTTTTTTTTEKPVVASA